MNSVDLIILFVCQAIMRQLVDEMHSKGVFYQDIKPDSIVIENSAERLAHPCVKYTDFGCGVIFTPEAVT